MMRLNQKTDLKTPSVASVREDCARVMPLAQHVHVHEEKIETYTRSLLQQNTLIDELGSDVHFVSDDSTKTANYILALDSINFGSGYFQILRKAGFDIGYARVASGLKRAFEEDFLATPDAWRKAQKEDFLKLLSASDSYLPELETLCSLFARHLQKTGAIVSDHYDGSSLHVVEEAKGSALRLADILAGWDHFTDRKVYKGREISFHKRAQIFAADIFLALKKHRMAHFDDIGALTCFADNAVPHVLKYDGVLSYTEELQGKIDRRISLASGSEEEIEIRAAAVHAVELMTKAAQKQGHHVVSMNIDHLLWERGRDAAIRALPTHITLTTDY